VVQKYRTMDWVAASHFTISTIFVFAPGPVFPSIARTRSLARAYVPVNGIETQFTFGIGEGLKVNDRVTARSVPTITQEKALLDPMYRPSPAAIEKSVPRQAPRK